MTGSFLVAAAVLAAAFWCGYGRGRGNREKSREKQETEQVTSWSVGSPVSGRVTDLQEGENAAVVITPSEDRLYAPAGGKITRLFPMGNELLFSTEFGAELLIQAGDAQDELLGRYFRPKIVQNEIVPKGRLLLEFDRSGLEAEGCPVQVSVCLKSSAYGSSVQMTAGERVRTGEEILQIQERDLSGETLRG